MNNSSNNKIKIGVLMGGRSIEKEVSFNSGRTICDHLDTNKYDIIPIFQNKKGLLFILPWYFLHRGKISDFEFRLEKEAQIINWNELKSIVDFIYLAIHGKNCEDGSIQGMLEFLNIPYSGSSFYTGSITSNKFLNNQILGNNNIKTPKNFLIKNYENDFSNALNFAKKLGFPIVSKPNDEGSSFGVHISNNEEELIHNIIKAKNINNHDKVDVLIEEYINGIEFSCICIQNNNEWISFEPTEIAHKNNSYIFEYSDKYMPGEGEKYTPMHCSQEQIEKVKNTCLKIAKIIEAKDIIRIDGFINSNNEVIIIDCNILPGTAPSSFTFMQASLYGMSNADLINHIVHNGLKRYKKFENFINFNIQNSNKNEDSKVRIGVVFGGNNNEKEISLDSGRNVFYKLSSNKYKVTPIFLTNKNYENENKFYELTINQLVKNKTDEIVLTLNKNSEICISQFNSLFDFIFIALHGGQGENGCIQGVLETLNIPYNGCNISTSAICMDKYKTYKMLENNNINVPNHFLISKNTSIEEIKNNYFKITTEKNIPIIAKPYNDGCSFMVSVSYSLDECIYNINEVLKENEYCLMEECINAMELTVGVIGNNDYIIMPPSYTLKVNDILSLEEKFLPGAGENITPAPLSDEDMIFVKNEIKKVAKILNISGYCRIDCFLKEIQNYDNSIEKKLIILECNTLPGLTPATCIFHQAAEIGMKPFEFINKIIELGLEK